MRFSSKQFESRSIITQRVRKNTIKRFLNKGYPISELVKVASRGPSHLSQLD